VVDADGLIWNARWGSGCVDAYTPDGVGVRNARVPVRQASCPVFVGAHFGRMPMTSAMKEWTRQRAADPERGRTFLLDLKARAAGTSRQARPHAKRRLAPSRMSVFMALAELQGVIDHRLSSLSAIMVPTMRRTHRRQKQTATTRRLRVNPEGVKHEFAQIDAIRHRAWFGRPCGTRARAGQAQRRHRHADQGLGALDR